MRTPLCLLLVTAVACGGGPPSEPADPLSLRAPESQLVPGQSTQLELTTTSGQPANVAGATFTSSASAVASVTAQGVVTAVAPGNTTITAQEGSRRATVAISVLPGGVLTPDGSTLRMPGGELELVAPAGAVDAATPVRLSVLGAPPWVDPTVVRGAVFSVGQDGQRYLKPLTLKARYTTTTVPYGLPQSALGLRRASPMGAWIDIRPSTVDSTTGTVTATVTESGTYSVGRLVPTTPCVGAAYRAFDFWVGSWNMTNLGQPVGENFITAESTGCAIFENYITATNLSPGRSISFYNPDTDRWYQTYIDAGNNMVLLRSTSYANNHIPMVSPAQGNVFTRTTWSLNGDGTVRQFIEATVNNGQTFSTQYDLLYRKK